MDDNLERSIGLGRNLRLDLLEGNSTWVSKSIIDLLEIDSNNCNILLLNN